MSTYPAVAATFLAVIGMLSGGEFPQAARAAGARDGLVLEYRFDGSVADSSGNTPVMVVEGRRIAAGEGEFSSAVGGAPQVAAATAPDRPLAIAPTAELTRVIPLDGDGWLIATDPKNEGRQEKWSASPAQDAKPTKVPWPIQDVFPDYHGVAWYWREFTASRRATSVSTANASFCMG